MVKENLVYLLGNRSYTCLHQPYPKYCRHRCGNREVDFTFRAPEKKYILKSR